MFLKELLSMVAVGVLQKVFDILCILGRGFVLITFNFCICAIAGGTNIFGATPSPAFGQQNALGQSQYVFKFS